MIKEKKKIVILGGGFGGLYTFKSLCKEFHKDEVEVTIVNRTNYFLFTPLLHEVATGAVAHHQVVESIRQVIYKTHTNLHVAELLSVDCEKQIVKTSVAELPYDVLVLALGATTNFFNSPGAEEFSFVLKDLDDAITLRNRFIETFEKASEIKDAVARRKMLSFAIIGGGATGVELTGELEALFNNTFLKYYKDLIDPADITLYLVNLGPDLLAPFKPSARIKALEVLKKNGATVMLNTGVKEVTKEGLILNDGSFIEANTVIWTAGVKPNKAMFSQEVLADKGGRVVVGRTLQTPTYPNVFVIGDMASMQDAEGRPLPMLAQVAELQGKHTGKNIKKLLDGKPLAEFSFHSKGELASLGQRQAVADIYGMQFSGVFAWFLWRTVYLFKFLSKSKKVKIAVDWTMNLFYPHDITKA